MVKYGALVYLASLEDRFGQYGRIALAIVRPDTDGNATLDTFLMSCRAIGRKGETTFLALIIGSLRRCGFHTMTASFVPTKKNGVSSAFLPTHGFTKTDETARGEIHYHTVLADSDVAPCPFYEIVSHEENASNG